MTNLLYLILCVACVYVGFASNPLWTVLPLGFAGLVLFFNWRPGPAATGLKERGAFYVVMMFVGSVLPAGVLFFVGRLVGWAIA